MKQILSAMLAVIAVLAILLALTQIDDDLSEEALALVRILEEPKESQAYIYLLGINAAPDVDPLEVGGNLLEEYRKQEADEDYRVVEYRDPDQILPPEGELFCGFFHEGCATTLFTSDFNIEELEREHAVLLERLEALHGFGDYQTLSTPSVSEHIPAFHYIASGERIRVLRAISLHKKGRSREAVDLLLKRLEVLRESFALQDNLIGKMIYVIKISEIVDVASIILTEGGSSLKAELIPGMTLAEKELDRVSAREFGMSYYLFKNLNKSPDIFEVSDSAQEGETKEAKVPGWVLRITYKPNMTINAVVPFYTRMTRLSKLSPGAFAEEIDSGDVPVISTSRFRNYVGYTLASVAWPNADEYIGRIMDVETKIELFNQIYYHGKQEDKVENPYYEGEYSYREGDAVCFHGPLKDERRLRCLRTAY